MEGTQKITPKLASEKITEREILQACQNHKKAQLKENTVECRKATLQLHESNEMKH